LVGVLAFCKRNFPVSIGGQDLTFLGGRQRRLCPAKLLTAKISSGAGIRWCNPLAATTADITFWTYCWVLRIVKANLPAKFLVYLIYMIFAIKPHKEVYYDFYLASNLQLHKKYPTQQILSRAQMLNINIFNFK
jgi:hypothetical protein